MSRFFRIGLLALLTALLSTCSPRGAQAEFSVCSADCARNDQIWLVSTRHLGCTGCGQPDPHLRSYRKQPHGWQPAELDELLADPSSAATVVYVHGNRFDPDDAVSRGLFIYRQLVRCAPPTPIRFVIWSWPSSSQPGLIQDARAKAARTNVDGYYLGWFLQQLDPRQPVSLIGYSFGARIITGGLHLLGGGSLCGRTLAAAGEFQRSYRVVLMAAALHSDWLCPGRPHQMAMSQVDQLLLLYNSRDRVLKRYHVVQQHAHPAALGYTGLRCRGIGCVMQRDVTREVGKRHSEAEYYDVPSIVQAVRHHAILPLGTELLLETADEETPFPPVIDVSQHVPDVAPLRFRLRRDVP